MKRRSSDLRKIRTTISYSVSEIASLLGITKGTVRRWIVSGLPCIDDQKPILLHGFVLKQWLEKKKQSRKSKCAANEMFCLKCRKPRPTMPGSIIIVQTNPKISMIKALCIDCGSQMNKAASHLIAAEWGKPKKQARQPKLNLIVSNTSPLNDDSGGASHRDLFDWAESTDLERSVKAIENSQKEKSQ